MRSESQVGRGRGRRPGGFGGGRAKAGSGGGGDGAWWRWCRLPGHGAGVGGQELGEEAAVAVAEDEGLVAGWELREEVGAGALEEGAEGEVFGVAVDAGDGIEVGRCGMVWLGLVQEGKEEEGGEQDEVGGGAEVDGESRRRK